ncbi:biotin-dependent carboxylase-like uncharacterized protein [Ulvibacter sp. MAR_2010_11]|uniref:5-oxoprolinase subunit C family protein n=1 Tax=Ulvibacter sp. MAR_2010_11 TaxID=1250229 RepID=UPI000C2C8B2F|nr:biotin-dependent carboxyltransferase family protein [Ulvibacter sp. MAR_2010_11]PKA84428.1 biotin-dependent carboxylase-like uncharacterized protein [Ulvibacter sp. MAR_2010_11]
MIEVVSGGLYTSLQDLGRYGYRKYGVPLSGAMDSFSAELANRLVGNAPSEAVMEITYIGPVLRFLCHTQIAIAGAGFSPTVNNIEIPLNTRIDIAKDSLLKFGLPDYGMRAYLSVAKGFQSEKVFDSYSYYEGITSKQTIATGDFLEISPSVEFHDNATASVKVRKIYFSSEAIEVTPGPEFHHFTKSFQQKLIQTRGPILAESNRMAYLLNGFESYSAPEMITAPVQPGTVQLTPSGKCVILMRDAQTTGGYARILQLTEASINILAQKRAGEIIQFKLI